MADLNAVDWTQVGEQLAVVLGAAIAAFAGARRVWKKGLGDLIRPAIRTEVSTAVRNTLRTLREEIVEQTRSAMHEELAPLRDEVDELAHRMSRAEGKLEVLTNSRGDADTAK
jgi:hypothetical protein